MLSGVDATNDWRVSCGRVGHTERVSEALGGDGGGLAVGQPGGLPVQNLEGRRGGRAGARYGESIKVKTKLKEEDICQQTVSFIFNARGSSLST